MRSLYIPVLMTILHMGTAMPLAPGPSSPDPRVGEWQNVNDKARGVTRISIRDDGKRLVVRMWASCRPVACEWGESAAIDAEGLGDDRRLVRWRTPFSITLQEIEWTGQDTLQLSSFTWFTDPPWREPHCGTDRFRRIKK